MKNVPLQNAPAVLRHAETPVSCLAALPAFPYTGALRYAGNRR